MSDMLHSDMVRLAEESANRINNFVVWLDQQGSNDELDELRRSDEAYRVMGSRSSPNGERLAQRVRENFHLLERDPLQEWFEDLLASTHVIVPDALAEEVFGNTHGEREEAY